MSYLAPPINWIGTDFNLIQQQEKYQTNHLYDPLPTALQLKNSDLKKRQTYSFPLPSEKHAHYTYRGGVKFTLLSWHAGH